MLFFGVPITVEYNIENLSANLTPMTSKHTKKLYTVPKNNFNTKSVNTPDVIFSELNKHTIKLTTLTKYQ